MLTFCYSAYFYSWTSFRKQLGYEEGSVYGEVDEEQMCEVNDCLEIFDFTY